MSHLSPAARALRLGLAAAFLTLCAHAAHALPPQTYVSVNGDDTYPCARAAPCRSFAAALPKTAVGGEVIVLDSGEYGRFTVNASVRVTAVGVYAGVTATGTHGVVVEPPEGSVVVLRGLTISTAGTNWAGIYYAGPGPTRETPQNPLVSLHVKDCTINGFEMGVRFQGAGALLAEDTTVRNSTYGIWLGPPPSGAISATVVDGRLERCLYGLRAVGPGAVEVTARDTVAAHIGMVGFSASGGGTRMQLYGCVATHQTNGVAVNQEARAALVGCAINNTETGIAVAQFGLVQLSDTTVTNNQVGIDAAANGKVHTLGNNGVFDNAVNTKGGPFFVLQPF